MTHPQLNFASDKAIVGMIHVRALPGTPHHRLSINRIVETAADEARVLAEAGCDALIIENMHDRPYLNRTGPPQADPPVLPPERLAPAGKLPAAPRRFWKRRSECGRPNEAISGTLGRAKRIYRGRAIFRIMIHQRQRRIGRQEWTRHNP